MAIRLIHAEQPYWSPQRILPPYFSQANSRTEMTTRFAAIATAHSSIQCRLTAQDERRCSIDTWRSSSQSITWFRFSTILITALPSNIKSQYITSDVYWETGLQSTQFSNITQYTELPGTTQSTIQEQANTTSLLCLVRMNIQRVIVSIIMEHYGAVQWKCDEWISKEVSRNKCVRRWKRNDLETADKRTIRHVRLSCPFL